MGISSTINRVIYSCDGSSTIFPFPYEFFNTIDLKVYLFDTSAANSIIQLLGTNYTVSGGINSQGVYTGGGSVILASAAPTGIEVVIYRDPAQVQNYSLSQNGQINSLALVQEFDYQTLLLQRLNDHATRAVRLSSGLGTVNGISFNPILPDKIVLASSAYAPIIVNSGATGFDLGMVATGPSGPISYAGVLPYPNGGTGVATTPQQGQVLIGNGSSYTLANIQAGPNVTISNGPGSIVISATAGSSNITPFNLGGTGLSSVPLSGQTLIGNGNGYSLSTLIAGSNVSIVNGSGTIIIAASPPMWNYTAQISTYSAMANDWISASGSSFPIMLPTAVGVAGRSIFIQHSGSSLVQSYQLLTTNSQVIKTAGGVISSGGYTLYTNSETVRLDSDNAGWVETVHKSDTPWTSFPNINFGVMVKATGIAPSAGTEIQNIALWKRRSDTIEINWNYRQITTGVDGSGIYLFDFSQLGISHAPIIGDNAGTDLGESAVGIFNYSNGSASLLKGSGKAMLWNSTQIYCYLAVSPNSPGNASNGIWGGSFGQPSLTSSIAYSLQATFPIANWRP